MLKTQDWCSAAAMLHPKHEEKAHFRAFVHTNVGIYHYTYNCTILLNLRVLNGTAKFMNFLAINEIV